MSDFLNGSSSGNQNFAQSNNAPSQPRKRFEPVQAREYNGRIYENSFVASLFPDPEDKMVKQGRNFRGIFAQDYGFPGDVPVFLKREPDGFDLYFRNVHVAEMKLAKTKNGDPYFWGKVKEKVDEQGVRFEGGCRFSAFQPRENSASHRKGAEWNLKVEGIGRMPNQPSREEQDQQFENALPQGTDQFTNQSGESPPF